MKQPIQTFLRTLGFRLVRLENAASPEHARSPLDSFFSSLKERGFAPRDVVDVGANHGSWTRTALRYFPDAYFTLVEPQDHLRIDVQDLLARGGRVQWISAAASDKIGTLPLTISRPDDSSRFILTPEAVKVFGGFRVREVEVPVTTLNEIVRASNLPSPDKVKIDAERFDLRVLAGASELIGKTDIFLLEATVCARDAGQGIFENSLGNVIQTMDRAGYRIFDITDLNRSPKHGFLWLCEVAFLRKASRLLDGVTYE